MGMIITEGMIMGGDTIRATTMIKVEALGTIADTMTAGMIENMAEIVTTGMTDSLSISGGL